MFYVRNFRTAITWTAKLLATIHYKSVNCIVCGPHNPPVLKAEVIIPSGVGVGRWSQSVTSAIPRAIGMEMAHFSC